MIYAWFDIEGGGYTDSPRFDPILEIAMVLTKADLVPIPGASLSLVIKPKRSDHPGWEDGLDPVVRQMHTKNGLLRAVQSGLPLAEVEQALLDMIAQHAAKDEKVRPSGSGIRWFDLPRIEIHMPRLYRRFDRKTTDLSETRRFVRDLCGRDDLRYEGREKHRAMPDTEDILEEARMLAEAIRAD